MTTFVTTRPRARKDHVCSDCGRIIGPGETYRRGVGFDDGTAWTWKDCAHCEATLDLYGLSWDGTYNDDDFYEWATDGHNEWSEVRHAAGYLMRWRTRSGTLLPVPGQKDDPNPLPREETQP